MANDALTPESVHCEAHAHGHIAFGLTPRALLLLLAGLVFLVPAFFAHSFVWGLLVWDSAILLLVLRDYLLLPPASLIQVERLWLTVPAQGVEAEVEIHLQQRSKSLLLCQVTDDLSAKLVETPPQLWISAYPNVSAAARYRFIPRQRGDHLAGRIFVRYWSPIELIARWAVADVSQIIRVYPYRRPGEEADLFLARMRQVEQQLRRQRMRGLGRDFESLRDYREGDDLRDICWTATARRGTPVTRQYQVERSQPVWIVMDAGRLLQTEVGISTKLDYSASTSLSLARLAIAGGDRVGLLAYGRQIQQRVGLGRGASHLRQLMDATALVVNEPSEADHLRATVTLNRLQPRRSLVLWITDLAESAMRPEVIDGATQLMRRHLVLFVVMRQDELMQLAGSRPDNAEQMYRRAAAQDILFRRETLLAKLRERGAITLETTPKAMTSNVLNCYLEIKQRAML